MRLFVALDLAEEILVRLHEALAGYRRMAPRARWTRMESLHLTLKFIGEIDASRESAVTGALREIHAESFPLDAMGLGVFPQPRRPRVFWAGIRSSAELQQLARSIEGALLPLGIPAEERTFSPHLTLARGSSAEDLLPLTPLLSADQPLWGHQVMREFHLYQSHPSRGTYQYEKRASFPLAPA